MKKVLFIMAAALMTMTQCRKQETMPMTPSANTIKMTVTAGSGAKTDINTETGAITWSAGDKLYVSDSTSWLGSLTLVSGAGTPQGTFTGSIAAVGEGVTTCHFFYLGRDNGMEEPTGSTAANISLASQDGTLSGAMKFHTGYGRTDVLMESGEYEGYVLMNTKIAIAHLNLTMNDAAYTGSVTMTGVSNTLSVTPAGIFSGGDDGSIAIGNGDGTTGDRYVTLIPTTAPIVSVAFTGDATGSMTFLAGIHENKFYGMKDAIAVTLEAAAPKFTVGKNDQGQPITVEFAPGNLWYGKAGDDETAAFHFEANQWGTQPASNGQWVSDHVSHFFWSKDAAKAYAEVYDGTGAAETDVFFTEAEGFKVGNETGWRTLSKAEWDYLLNTRCNNNASSLRAWKDLGNGVKGLVILPDGTENPSTVMGGITSTADLASSGAVFLPASGDRNGTAVYGVGFYGDYWSSTPYEGYEDIAYRMFFNSGLASTYYDYRSLGYAVRLVR